MNYIEQEIADLDRMIRKIEQNPDPNRLKSNKLAYELRREHRLDELTAWHEGKPLIAGGGGWHRLERAMGFHTSFGPIVMLLVLRKDPEKTAAMLENIRNKGFPGITCDIPLMGLGGYLSGEVPLPSLMLTCDACGAAAMFYTTMAEWFHIPQFRFDMPLEKANRDTLPYWTKQIREFIEFAESTVPGIKFDEEKLAELQEWDRKAGPYYRENYKQRQRVPCPIPAREGLRIPELPSVHPNPEKALKWIIAWTDELRERADAGVSTLPKEKLRLGWTVTAPIYRNVFKQCEERGVAIPVVTLVNTEVLIGKHDLDDGGLKEYGKKLSPLEEEARRASVRSWGGLGYRWVNDVIDVCRDMKVDGLVNFLQRGCVPVLGLKKVVADRVEKELGIPTLQIEGSSHDPNYMIDASFDIKLQEFIDMCLLQKEEKLKTL